VRRLKVDVKKVDAKGGAHCAPFAFSEVLMHPGVPPRPPHWLWRGRGLRWQVMMLCMTPHNA